MQINPVSVGQLAAEYEARRFHGGSLEECTTGANPSCNICFESGASGVIFLTERDGGRFFFRELFTRC
jgi:hypothetical protein